MIKQSTDNALVTVPGSEMSVKKNSSRGVGDSLGFLCFMLDEEEYGMDLNLINQILKPPLVTKVPRSSPCIMGVISVRGDVVTLVDARLLLGFKSTSHSKTAKVLLTKLEDEQIGLLVDAVTQVRRIPYDAFEQNPILDDSRRSEWVIGIARPDSDTQITVIELKDVLMETLR